MDFVYIFSDHLPLTVLITMTPNVASQYSFACLLHDLFKKKKKKHNLFPWFLAHQKDNKFREGTRQTDFQVSWSLQQPRFHDFQT